MLKVKMKGVYLMDINIITNELILKFPVIEKAIKLLKFQYFTSQNFVALYHVDTMFYTDRLF